ncbi:MAG: DUF1028 domain-containing protein [Dermatophilaceae bacterium]
MTFSIVGGMGTAYGVAVASKFLAVGSVVPAALPGVGAVATQSFAKVSYKADGLGLLAKNVPAQDVIDRLTAADPLRETRQIGIVGPRSSATFTGHDCMDWAGGVAEGSADEGFVAIQGNILTGPEVVDAMLTAWRATSSQPLPDRLLAALLAGDDAGGDKRGRQGAALYAVEVGAGYDECGVIVDLRVDDHPHASRELSRLMTLNTLYFGEPEDVSPLEGTLAEEVGARLGRLGYAADATTEPAAALDAALAEWAGVENYEMRLVPGGIDGRVLQALREATP